MQPQHIHQDIPGGVPLKMWTHGVPVDDAAVRQLTNAARLPIDPKLSAGVDRGLVELFTGDWLDGLISAIIDLPPRAQA